jgi:hypothetical protein
MPNDATISVNKETNDVSVKVQYNKPIYFTNISDLKIQRIKVLNAESKQIIKTDHDRHLIFG